jgi:type II secretory pathway component GspD/PulD (secretin)
MKSSLFVFLFSFFVLVFLFSGTKCAEGQPMLAVSADGSKISVHADRIPLQELLSELAKTSSIKIYFAPSLSEVPVTASFENLPFEKGMRRLFKDFNFLASFKREKGTDRLAALKIYPKGTSSGALVQINAAKKVVVVGSAPAASETDDRTMTFSQEDSDSGDQALSDDRDTQETLISSRGATTEQDYDANGLKVNRSRK